MKEGLQEAYPDPSGEEDHSRMNGPTGGKDLSKGGDGIREETGSPSWGKE